MDPNNQPMSPPANPYGTSPTPASTPTPTQSPSPSDFDTGGDNKTKKIVIIGAIVVVIILSIVAVVAVLSGGDKNKKEDAGQTAESAELTRNPTAIDIENINNSINSNITGLDDARDFPEANLNDDSLGL